MIKKKTDLTDILNSTNQFYITRFKNQTVRTETDTDQYLALKISEKHTGCVKET